MLLFFWPQGIAVIELAHRYPGEGGVYLWAKEVFGDFHGFLSGWCYWTNNMMYVPTVMLYFVGVSVFVLGPSHYALADTDQRAIYKEVFEENFVLRPLVVPRKLVAFGVRRLDAAFSSTKSKAPSSRRTPNQYLFRYIHSC